MLLDAPFTEKSVNNELSLLFAVIVESGTVIPFVVYINSGHCNIYRDIVGLVRLQPRRVVSSKSSRSLYPVNLRQGAQGAEHPSTAHSLHYLCVFLCDISVQCFHSFWLGSPHLSCKVPECKMSCQIY